MKKKTTIIDVAQLAGVSISTVSRVLSGKDTAITISQETRDRVKAAASELQYHPHPGARSLRGKTTNLLGLIVRQIDDPFFSQLVETIRSVVKGRGMDIVLGYAESDPQEALILSQMLADLRFCDGLFLLGDLNETFEDRTYLAEIGREHRLVLLCRGSESLSEALLGDNPSVGTDNQQGSYLAMQHLASLGHKRIAFMGTGRLGDMSERQEAYMRFMHERSLDMDLPVNFVQIVENSFQGGLDGMMKLLSLPKPPTAVFAADDTLAVGAIKAVDQVGLKVPGDMSVVGFDDVRIAAYINPSLTTVRQPIEKIAQTAVDMLVHLIQDEEKAMNQRHVLIQPELVARESCARLIQ